MATTLYLTRHGQTEWNLETKLQGHKDSPLTVTGIEQAGWLHDHLDSVTFDAIYSSSSPRALRTANIITGNSHTDIVTLDALKEINMGLWEGMRKDDIKKDYSVQLDHFFAQPHLYQPTSQGESYNDLQQRVVPAIQDIIAAHQDQQVLVVTHFITLKVIMGYFMNKQLHEIGTMPDIHPTALFKVRIEDDNNAEVLLYGDTSHYREN
jgi:broad specificity phosphatase PhoE